MDIALLLSITPEDAEEIPFIDSVMLLERHYEKEHARAKMDAALHGMEIR
jgi:hypothetical protein